MAERRYIEELVDQEDNFDRWYVEVVQKAGLADDAPVRGCKVIRPYGYGLWELMVARLDARIKATGVENAYFPLFIPRSMLEREANHIEGFAPEVAWVTRGGDHELEEPWAVRPTSEAIICPSYARWVDGRWFWRLPNSTPQVRTKSPDDRAPNLLTARDWVVSKLSAFGALLSGLLRNRRGCQNVLTRCAVEQVGRIELAQLAHISV